MRVAVVYHMFPHYRFGVIHELDLSALNDYTFIASDKQFEGIKPIPKESFKDFRLGNFVWIKGFFWQQAAINASISKEFDVIIFLANPNFFSTWVAAIIARVTGKRVLFWTHGWLKVEKKWKSHIRNIFYRLAHTVMVYGERAKELGMESGFPDRRIAVIYNSLDVTRANKIISQIEAGVFNQYRPQSFFSKNHLPLLICTARLITLCRFDLLFEAALKLKNLGRDVNILLIGDGPERINLENMARELKISVHFYGACYEEEIIAQMIYHADLTVSPGKIGLTAMHSLMYGTPAITHSDFDFQMPEVESIISGATGGFFKRNDVDDLAANIAIWLDISKDRSAIRNACRKVISEKWNPKNQSHLIEAAIRNAL